MKAWACVGTHGKIYYCAISQNLQLQGRLEVYQNEKDARNNALGDYFVREVTITVHKKKPTKRKTGEGKMSEFIDGYTAQRIKQFWMSQPQKELAQAGMSRLVDRIIDLESTLARYKTALEKLSHIPPGEFNWKYQVEEFAKATLHPSPQESGKD